MREFIVKQRATTERELESMKNFLRSNQLPADDLKLDSSCLLMYYNGDDKLMGTGALEFYNQHALLRSLAVSPEVRGQQLGKQMVYDLLEQAAAAGCEEVYLLTETAPIFFKKFGFVEWKRDQVPVTIQSSSEFSYACPTSAQVMKLVVA